MLSAIATMTSIYSNRLGRPLVPKHTVTELFIFPLDYGTYPDDMVGGGTT